MVRYTHRLRRWVYRKKKEEPPAPLFFAIKKSDFPFLKFSILSLPGFEIPCYHISVRRIIAGECQQGPDCAAILG